MRCIAIDDEPKALAVIQYYAQQVPLLQLTATFRSGLDALESLQKEPAIDLIFLDINMPDLTGLEFLQALPQPPLVIFTTAYSEYAVQSYDWETVVGYLLKPIEFPKFIKAVNKAATQHQLRKRAPKTDINESEEYILVKSGTQTYQLKLSEILYIEASGNHVFFITKERKIITLNTLQEIAKLLPPHLFYRVHKSFIISRQHLEIIESYQVKINGREIPLGKTFREPFLEAFKK
jgi:two-component system, LytTR family, response regulator